MTRSEACIIILDSTQKANLPWVLQIVDSQECLDTVGPLPGEGSRPSSAISKSAVSAPSKAGSSAAEVYTLQPHLMLAGLSHQFRGGPMVAVWEEMHVYTLLS